MFKFCSKFNKSTILLKFLNALSDLCFHCLRNHLFVPILDGHS